MDELKNTLRRALASQFGLRVSIDDDTQLFSSGLIDSLNVMELVSFVEGAIGQSIAPAEIVLENFDSIERIAQLALRLAPKTSS